MSRWHPLLYRSAIFVAVNFFFLPLFAENVTNAAARTNLFSFSSNLLPPQQRLSPVDSFRELLAMSPGARRDFLTNRPPESRERILAKIREYQELDPNERELRLRATELRWYLMPLMRDASTNREVQLAQVPGGIRDLVKSRLKQWEILPPQLQQEFLQNQRALRYFAELNITNHPASDDFRDGASDEEKARWSSLSEEKRQAMTAEFNQFFELTSREKQKTLNTLSDAEREQMEKTLQSFDQLPPLQRRDCIRAYTKFADMSSMERAEFLKNAQRWSQLSPKERQAWRDLVAQVPQWPPMPMENLVPPKPAKVSPRLHTVAATNLN